ncbi:cobalamin biosynthesis protein [Actinacidiphila sp. bgisy167]|uniref:cobalamin biosynthesis protein n=1 Tax=Actinacidiphila sp. bgisy167 TaxID=3413797 RepID=UPI003D7210CA
MRVVVGVGAGRGVAAADVLALLGSVLDEAGVPRSCVTALASVDAKAGEPGLLEAAARLGVPLVTFDASALAAVDVPSPSSASLAAVGTPSVAEAAALAATDGGELLVPKRTSGPGDGAARATAAVARHRTPEPGVRGAHGMDGTTQETAPC